MGILLFFSVLSYASSTQITFSEFQNAVTSTVSQMQAAKDQDAYCGFFAFKDAQGLTLIVNSSAQTTQNIFIPKGSVVQFSEKTDPSKESSTKTYNFKNDLEEKATLKMIQSHSAFYDFWAVMLSHNGQTVNCAVTAQN